MDNFMKILLFLMVFSGCENNHIDADYLKGDWQSFDKDSNYYEYSFINDSVGIFNEFFIDNTIHKFKIKDDTMCFVNSNDHKIWKCKMKKQNKNRFDLELTTMTINSEDTLVDKYWCNFKRIKESEITFFDVKQRPFFDTIKRKIIFPDDYNKYLDACSDRQLDYYNEINKK